MPSNVHVCGLVLGVELWTGSKQTEEEAMAEVDEPEDKVEVTKVDMRKKENKPSPEDIKKMEAIMDSIVGTVGEDN